MTYDGEDIEPRNAFVNTIIDKDYTYEILDEEIDIQAIEIIKNVTNNGKYGADFNTTLNIAQKVNDLIKAIKQLDKKLK